MKILITGALGHIGSKLIHSIKAGQFREVRLIDNLLTQRYASLFNLSKNVNFRFFQEDICNCDLDKYFKGIDVVIHLAAITDAASTFDKKELVEEVNFLGTQKVAASCLKNGCKLIFPSTTSVYGTQSACVDENFPPEQLKPQSPYAESKFKAEKFLEKLGQDSGLKFIICRFGTIFGTSIGMRFHTAVNKFTWQACMNEPITVWRTAMQQRRPYLDLDDAVRAIFFIIEKNLFNRQVYNVVTTNTTVAQIIKIIRKRIPAVRVKYVDSAIMNQLTYTVLSDKFKGSGFRFIGKIDKGINDTIKLLAQANQRRQII